MKKANRNAKSLEMIYTYAKERRIRRNEKDFDLAILGSLSSFYCVSRKKKES